MTTPTNTEESLPEAPDVEVPRRPGLGADLRTIPNIISIVRIFAVLTAVMLFVYDLRVAGLLLGICAGLTDYLDGYLARRLNQETVLGAILDRLSDLIFEMCGFMFGVYFHIISPWLFIVYMMREVTVISARSFVSKLGKSLPTSIWGKLKTNFLGYSFFFIYLSVSGVIEDPKINDYVLDFGTFGLCCGLGFSYISGFKYLRAFRVVYNEHVDHGEQER